MFYDDYSATQTERESARILSLLQEVGLGRPFNSYYGDTANLSNDRHTLVSWCARNTDKVPSMSLELQMWWRDFKRAEAIAKEKEAAAKRKEEIRKGAIAKLTPEEINALDLERKR